jgi:hypothetical protein
MFTIGDMPGKHHALIVANKAVETMLGLHKLPEAILR